MQDLFSRLWSEFWLDLLEHIFKRKGLVAVTAFEEHFSIGEESFPLDLYVCVSCLASSSGRLSKLDLA